MNIFEGYSKKKGIDLLSLQSVCSLGGNEIENMNAATAQQIITNFLRGSVFPKHTVINPRVVKNLYDHSLQYGKEALSAIFAIPSVLQNGVVISRFDKVAGKTEQSGLKAAPITIGGTAYIGVVISLHSNKENSVFPYAIRIFSIDKIKQLLLDRRTSLHSPNDGASCQMPTEKQSAAKILIDYITINTPQEKIDSLINSNPTNKEQIPKQSTNESKRTIRINGTDLRKMIQECVEKILSEQSERMVGDYKVIDGDSLISCSDSLKQFGWYNHIKMYDNTTRNKPDWETYCLLKRRDNGTYFFAEIVDAPELGKGETKFQPLKPSEVPRIILRDVQSLLRNGQI